MITINDARITFLAGECFTDHLDGGRFSRSPLWSDLLYDWAFDQVRGGQRADFAFPWRDGQKSSFWRHYLGGAPGNAPAWRARSMFVPFRLPVDASPASTDAGERLLVDVFGYRFGTVVALTVNVVKGDRMPMDVWIARLRELRLGTAFAWAGVPTNLDGVLDALLELTRARYFDGVGWGTRSAEPFSINVVLQAEGGDPASPVDEQLQRRLHAVTAWPADWVNAILPPPTPPTFLAIRGRNAVPGDVHYAVGRGRTIWRPGLFARRTPGDGPRRRHTLSCLSHNLVAGSMQSEMLRLVAVRRASVGRLPGLDKGSLRGLGRIADGLRQGLNSFRSSSLQMLLEDPSSRAAVNELLSAAGAPTIR